MSMERTRYPGVFRRGSRYVAVVSFKDGEGRRRQQWLTRASIAERSSLRRSSRASRPGALMSLIPIAPCEGRSLPGTPERKKSARRGGPPQAQDARPLAGGLREGPSGYEERSPPERRVPGRLRSSLHSKLIQRSC